MNQNPMHYVYGPVPSRRLGRSLGIDLIPFKTCTYDCIYCQLGRTTRKTCERKEYVPTHSILTELEMKLADDDKPDFISLAGSGEPTLNTGIGDLIGKIKIMTNTPVAVLTNGSLLWMSKVRDALMAADVVLPSLDAGDEHLFRYVNRPHKDFSLNRVINGISAFIKQFSGEVWMEVFLLWGVTGLVLEAEKIAAIISEINPARVQLNTVSRPPSEGFALPVSMEQMQTIKKLFPGRVEIITRSDKPPVVESSMKQTLDEQILALLARRPCTFLEVATGLGIHPAEAIKLLDELFNSGKVRTTALNEQTFFVANNTMLNCHGRLQ